MIVVREPDEQQLLEHEVDLEEVAVRLEEPGR
jgi:hypothetical protein